MFDQIQFCFILILCAYICCMFSHMNYELFILISKRLKRLLVSHWRRNCQRSKHFCTDSVWFMRRWDRCTFQLLKQHWKCPAVTLKWTKTFKVVYGNVYVCNKTVACLEFFIKYELLFSLFKWRSGSVFLSITGENHIWDSDRFNDTQANVQVV